MLTEYYRAMTRQAGSSFSERLVAGLTGKVKPSRTQSQSQLVQRKPEIKKKTARREKEGNRTVSGSLEVIYVLL